MIEPTEIQVISNVIAALTLTYSRIEKRLHYANTQLRAGGFLLNVTLELMWPNTCLIAFRPERCITQFAIITSVLLKIVQSNSSFAASHSMNNILSRIQPKEMIFITFLESFLELTTGFLRLSP